MKLTTKRREILNVLRDARNLLTAQELGKKLPDIDLATIYRNLALFVQEGIAREVVLSSKESAFEYAEGGYHHHVICSSCDEVQHITLTKEMLKKIPGLDHLDPETVEVTVRGKCKQ